ncbi:MAG: hypothetical protein ACT4QF_25500 [Sporichthyaceae bacterium]
MTPDDVAAIRAEMDRQRAFGQAPQWAWDLVSEHLALCDALEAAWAERDTFAAHWRVAMETGPEPYKSLIERAERAEAALETLKAEITDERSWQQQLAADAIDCIEAQAAALARVRALCEELHDTDEIVTEAYDRLRAALDGAQ